MTFLERLVAPKKDAPYGEDEYFKREYNAYNPYYGMPNCTCYTAGRVLEIAILNNEDLTPYINEIAKLGNGGQWGNDDKCGASWVKSTIPQAGAVVVWEGGDGHVAMVEKVYDDGTIKTSNSAWDGADNVGNEESTKWWYIRDNLNYNNYGDYTFRYFLYPPYFFKSSKTTKNKFPFFIINKKRFAKRYHL